MQNLLRPPLSVLMAGRKPLGDEDLATPEEIATAYTTLYDMSADLERVTVRLREAFEEVKYSVFSTIEQPGSEIEEEPPLPDRPSKDALIAFRLSISTGETQTAIAELMQEHCGRTTSQGQVSRWIKDVNRWLEECKILPALPEKLQGSVKSVDPKVIDQGANQTGRTPRQRKSPK